MSMITLNSGRTLDPRRPRSHGVLDAEELEYCRSHAVRLAYDPLQQGWVLDAAPDDVSAPLGHTASREHAARLLQRLDEFLRLQRANACASSGEEQAEQLKSARRFAASLLERAEFVRHGVLDVATWNQLHRRLLCTVDAAFRSQPALSATAAPELTAPKLEFRPWRESDLPVYREIVDNPKLWRFLPDAPSFPLTDERLLEMLQVARVEGHHEVRAVECEGTVIGQVRLLFEEQADNAPKAAEIAYFLGEQHWGRGLSSAIVARYAQRSFEAHGLAWLEAWIHPDNVASMKAALRASFWRDVFPAEQELAEVVGRPGCLRYVCTR